MRRWLSAASVVVGICAQDRRSSADQSAAAAFDRKAASEALDGVTLTTCKKPRKLQAGDGHVLITFDPSGAPSDVDLDRGPSPTSRFGKCVISQFSKVKVPPFDGPAVRVGKNFHFE
jgi:hypothetical protein